MIKIVEKIKNVEPGQKDLIFMDARLTDIGVFAVLNQGEKIFRSSLIELDTDHKYTSKSKPREVPSPEAVKRVENSYYSNFSRELKELEASMSKFRDENSDLFKDVPSLPNLSQHYSSHVNRELSKSIQDLDVACYFFLEFRSALEEFKKLKSDSIMVSKRKIIIPEYRDIYSEFRDKKEKELGIPKISDLKAEIDEKVQKSTVSVKRGLRKIEKPDGSDESFENVVKRLLITM